MAHRGHSSGCSTSFNPHPAALPGEWRRVRVDNSQYAGFNPHPAALPGEWEGYDLAWRESGFNPHPAALPGEWLLSRTLLAETGGFNPHPAALPGEWPVARLHGSPYRFQSAPGSAAG